MLHEYLQSTDQINCSFYWSMIKIEKKVLGSCLKSNYSWPICNLKDYNISSESRFFYNSYYRVLMSRLFKSNQAVQTTMVNFKWQFTALLQSWYDIKDIQNHMMSKNLSMKWFFKMWFFDFYYGLIFWLELLFF